MNFYTTMNGQVNEVSGSGYFIIQQNSAHHTNHYLWDLLETNWDYWNEDWVYVGY